MTQSLPLWNKTSTRQTLLEFVAAVSTPGHSNFVPPAERIATFDNDGTLWCEKPAYIQLFFAIERLRQIAKADPSLQEEPAYKAAIQGDTAYFASLYPGDIPSLMKVIFDTHAEMPQREFDGLALDFLNSSHHPRFGVPFKACIYQPMVELVRFLQDSDFKVFIASAGGMSFVRPISEEIYGIPRENVIGSNITFELGRRGKELVLLRKPGLVEPVDDGPGKPVNIELHIGRPPILAAGNSNGDIEMLEYAGSGEHPYLNLLLHHDDPEREYAYNQGAERALQLAGKRNWTVISIKDDWNSVFAFENNK